MFRAACALAFALLAAACSGGKADQNPPYPAPMVSTEGEVVARIGPVTLTTAELEARIQRRNPLSRVQLKDPIQKKKYVDHEIRQELLAQEGWRRGLPQDPLIQAELRRIIVQRVEAEELAIIGDSIKITDADLQRAYDARLAEFVKPPRIRLSQIVRYVDDEAGRREAKKLLEGLRTKILSAEKKNDPQAFSNSAREHSQDEATQNGGGDLQFLTRPELVERFGEEVAKAVFDDLTIGDMVIADAPNATILFKKTGLRRGVERTLEQVKPQLRGQLLGERRAEAFDAVLERLTKERGVHISYDALDKIAVDMESPTAPEAP